jgi:acetate---CoA ligase (ADP-forming)
VPPAPRTQERRGLEAILNPKSVAVIGASPNPKSIGHSILRNLIDHGFQGPIHPIHPTAHNVLGRRAYPRIQDAPGPIDLAVVAIPASEVVAVAEDCGQAGVKGLVVISAGFRETDEEGARREARLRETVQRHRMRMVGPNCLGVINNSEDVNLFATFGARPLKRGTTALVTQSGAVGIALMEHAHHIGLGLSRFVSMGNKTDVSGNDLLLLWEDDPEVRQILLYLENFGNPRNFVRIAPRLSRTKPIVVIKSGRTDRGARAAGSHTGALMQSDALIDALLEQCGVLRAQTAEELFDIANALDTQPVMEGERIAIVTNSGGPAILAVDAIEASGLHLAQIADDTYEKMAHAIPPESHNTNPIDLLAAGSSHAFDACISALAEDPEVDAVLAIWTPLDPNDDAPAQAIATAFAKAESKPGLAVVFGHGPGASAFDALKGARVPTFTFPENAVRALKALADVGTWRRRKPETPARPDVDKDSATALLEAARPGPDGWLAASDALALLRHYGIRVPEHHRVDDPQAAAEAAEAIGYPCVLKMEAPGLVHKTEAGGVRLGLTDAPAVAEAYAAATASLTAKGFAPSGALVMASIQAAPEILIGATQDPLFGPILACGAGGVYTEILRDVHMRLAPVSIEGAQRMISKLRIRPILEGARGAPASDLGALEDALLRLGRLIADFPQIAELEANPMRVLPRGQGAVALDARVRLAPPTTPDPSG